MVKLKVLISCPALNTKTNVSGISSVVSSLTRQLAENVDFEHLVLGAPTAKDIRYKKARSLWNILVALVQIVCTKATLFHSNMPLEFKALAREFVFVLIARAKGMRILLHIHGGKYVDSEAAGITNLIMQLVMRLANEVVFLSGTELSKVALRMPMFRAKMSYIYNFVEQSDLISGKRQLAEGDTINAVFIGRLTESKGIDFLMRAAPVYEALKMRVSIFGDGELRDRVQREAASSKSMEYCGVFIHDDWSRVLPNYDVLLLPSLWGEGMPMVILEAMSLGLVPVATDLGSISEIIKDRVLGRVIQSGDWEAFMDALHWLSDQRARLSSMGVDCREFAAENFDAKKNAKQFYDLYRSTVEASADR
jgi:glycosyltransferase involved in cell wall biosynthesis